MNSFDAYYQEVLRAYLNSDLLLLERLYALNRADAVALLRRHRACEPRMLFFRDAQINVEGRAHFNEYIKEYINELKAVFQIIGYDGKFPESPA